MPVSCSYDSIQGSEIGQFAAPATTKFPRRSHRQHLRAGFAAVVLAGTTLGATLAAAQAADPPRRKHPAARHAPAETAEEVDVVARRPAFRFSAAQHAADSTTRLTGQDLIRRGVVSKTDLQNLAPNLSVQSVNGTSSTNFQLRGIGTSDYTQNSTPSVLTYIDDVAFPVSTMSNGMLFDIDSVDIQPGPAGFTHGFASSGGEVALHTADPTPQWHGGVTEDIASYARSRTTGYISGPISPTLSFRIAAETIHGGGWQYDPANHTHLGDADETALRAKLKWTPDSRTTVKLTGHFVRDRSGVVVGQPMINLLGTRLPPNEPQQAYWDLSPRFARLIGRSPDTKPSEDNTFWGANITATHRFDLAMLTSISDYESERVGEYTDQDATTARTGDTYRNIVADSFIQELRLGAVDPDAKLQWDLGASYNRVRMYQQFFFDFSDYPLRGYLSETSFEQHQQTFAQYAHVSYALPWHLKIFGGLNHEADDRQLIGLRTVHYNVNSLDFADTATNANQFSGEIGLQWQPSRGFMSYVKVSRGFRPGGFTANNTVVQDQLAPYKPEWLLAYEAGFKSEPIPNVLRLNGAAFYDDYHDQQYLGSFVVPSYGPLGRFTNIPKSEIWGLEGSIDLHPLPHLYLVQNIGYERGKYQDFSAVNSAATNQYYLAHHVWTPIYTSYNGVDSGIPKLTLNGTATLRFDPLPAHQIEGGLDWSYRGAQALVPGGLGYYRLPDYFLLGAHLTWRATKQHWFATVYATNLLDRQYYVTGGQATTTYFYIPGTPRMIGGRFGVDF